jgi:hypothetical protein
MSATDSDQSKRKRSSAKNTKKVSKLSETEKDDFDFFEQENKETVKDSNGAVHEEPETDEDEESNKASKKQKTQANVEKTVTLESVFVDKTASIVSEEETKQFFKNMEEVEAKHLNGSVSSSSSSTESKSYQPAVTEQSNSKQNAALVVADTSLATLAVYNSTEKHGALLLAEAERTGNYGLAQNFNYFRYFLGKALKVELSKMTMDGLPTEGSWFANIFVGNNMITSILSPFLALVDQIFGNRLKGTYDAKNADGTPYKFSAKSYDQAQIKFTAGAQAFLPKDAAKGLMSRESIDFIEFMRVVVDMISEQIRLSFHPEVTKEQFAQNNVNSPLYLGKYGWTVSFVMKPYKARKAKPGSNTKTTFKDKEITPEAFPVLNNFKKEEDKETAVEILRTCDIKYPKIRRLTKSGDSDPDNEVLVPYEQLNVKQGSVFAFVFSMLVHKVQGKYHIIFRIGERDAPTMFYRGGCKLGDPTGFVGEMPKNFEELTDSSAESDE